MVMCGLMGRPVAFMRSLYDLAVVLVVVDRGRRGSSTERSADGAADGVAAARMIIAGRSFIKKGMGGGARKSP